MGETPKNKHPKISKTFSYLFFLPASGGTRRGRGTLPPPPPSGVGWALNIRSDSANRVNSQGLDHGIGRGVDQMSTPDTDHRRTVCPFARGKGKINKFVGFVRRE